MRKRYLIAAGTALALAAGGPIAFADNHGTVSPKSPNASAPTVTLPTGDAVTVAPSGSITWHPREGREHTNYVTLTAFDGSSDLIMIPSDKIEDLAKGKDDPRRYNISELLRDGETDAAKATKLSDKPYGRFTPVSHKPSESADNQDVTITATNHDGQAEWGGFLVYVNVKTGEGDGVDLDGNGKATVSLPPGDYDFQTYMTSEIDSTLGLTSATVGSEPVDITVDGTNGKPVSYEIDREAKLFEQSIGVHTGLPNGKKFSFSAMVSGDATGYVIAAPETDHPTGMELNAHFDGGGEDDPFTYDLHFLQDGGIPKDPTFTAHDDELAQVTTTFDGIATTAPTTMCNAARHADGDPFAVCTPQEVKWQSQRTEFYTPGPKIDWFTDTNIGDTWENNSIDIDSKDRYEAGKSQRTVGRTPLSVSVGSGSSEKRKSEVVRDGDKLNVLLPFMENASLNERVSFDASTTGTAVLERDGEEIARTDLQWNEVTFALPDKDSGRYTLSAELEHDQSLTPLASQTSVKWEFDSKPATEPTPVDISAAAFDAEGVSDGYADIDKEQKFTLDYRPQFGATDTKLKDLVFEVSYDDGKTWKEVDVAIDGDSANGTLTHPDGAKFVSVKASAIDDAGNQVKHSTVRSYGLK